MTARVVEPNPAPSLSFGMPSVLDLELTRLRALTASEKMSVMQSLWRQAWSLKTAGVQAHHPDWSPERVEVEVREIFRRDSQ